MQQSAPQSEARPAAQPMWDTFGSRQAPLLYLECPKSACTTIKNILFKLDHDGAAYPDPLAIHADREALLKHQNTDKGPFALAIRNRRLTFSFVREPYARAYSCFNEKFFHTGPYHFPDFRAELIRDYGARFPDEAEAYPAERHGENFAAFLRFAQDTLSPGVTVKPDRRHWMAQTNVLTLHRRRINIDFVGRVERLAADMRYVLDMAGVTIPVDLSVRYNEGPPAPFTLRDIITDRIAAALVELYAQDIEYFGYHDLSAKHVR